MLGKVLFIAASLAATTAFGADAPSVDEGLRISIVGGCHDCHTVGYSESNGQIDPTKALAGNPVGFQGPWGTNYAKNVRIVAGKMSEDDWVKYLKTFEAGPIMPWFNVHAMTEIETRSLYMYIKSLGEPGNPAPDDVPPGGKVTTPFNIYAPPVMPGA